MKATLEQIMNALDDISMTEIQVGRKIILRHPIPFGKYPLEFVSREEEYRREKEYHEEVELTAEILTAYKLNPDVLKRRRCA